jgi:arylsulfatase A
MPPCRVFPLLATVLATASALVAATPPPTSTGKAAQPNIIVLLCDDLGYGDLGCFANPSIHTPHLDQLARDGVKFTDCYSASPVCSPSRAGLMTGRNPNRLGIRDWIPPQSGIFMRPSEITVAQLLKKAGYRTLHAGKWHLNSRTDGSERTPGEAGFDHWLYTQNNAAPSHLNPRNFIRNGAPAGPLNGPSSHLVVAEATRWLDTTRANENSRNATPSPFFLNLWFHETHEPVAAAEEFLAPYLLEKNPDRRHYWGAATQMDAAGGQLLQYLDDHGLRENTFVFFTSDNGPETLDRYKGAQRSHGSPGPLRGMKLHITEAGYRVPGIIRWPGHAQPGTTSAEPICNLDFLPTACALAGIAPPSDRALDGANLLPLFTSQAIKRPHPLYWQYDFAISAPWSIALRDGPWKLLATTALDHFELYHLATDIAEKQNVARQHPERVQAMVATIRTLRSEIAAEGARSGNPPARQTVTKKP